MTSAHLLLVEDDEILGATLAENLQSDGYSVVWIKDGALALSTIKQGRFDLIVLDRMLPHKEGIEILSELRSLSDVPVMMISARGGAQDRILGLEQKADDYLAKPFHLNEFLLRVKNLLRRSVTAQRSSPLPEGPLHIGKGIFDLAQLRVRFKDGSRDTLSEKEAKMIQLLWTHANRVVSRQNILDYAWGYQSDPSPRTIDNFIVKLRKWVETDPSDPQIIFSHRGLGYSLHTSNRSSES